MLNAHTCLSLAVANQTLHTTWLDARVDLLDLLSQDGGHALLSNAAMVSADQPATPPPVGDGAVKLLLNMAEETTQMLAAGQDGDGGSDGSDLQPTVVAQSTADNLQSVVLTEDGPTSVDHLLDMLSDGMCPGDLGSSDPGDLGPMSVVDSDILTSVSAEDVESILSSEPPSPAAHNISDSCAQVSPDQSNSLLAQYLLGHIDPTPSPVSPHDVSDMESFTSEAHSSDDDSDYVPPSAFRVSKTRSSPYARGKSSKLQSKSKASTAKTQIVMDKKLRKKQQNKDAATRYRHKKREEADLIDKECQALEDRNAQLKDKVEQMTREIGYIKNLLAEVYKARGLITKTKTGK